MIKNSFYIFAGRASNALFLFLLTLVVSRQLGPALFGVFSFLIAVVVAANCFSNLGLDYLDQSQLSVEKMSRGFAWLDTGSHESLLDAANFIETIQRRQGLMVCCPEEIAYSKGWITAEILEKRARSLKKSGYGQYLMRLISQK